MSNRGGQTHFERAEAARKCSHGVSLLRACSQCEEERRAKQQKQQKKGDKK